MTSNYASNPYYPNNMSTGEYHQTPAQNRRSQYQNIVAQDYTNGTYNPQIASSHLQSQSYSQQIYSPTSAVAPSPSHTIASPTQNNFPR